MSKEYKKNNSAIDKAEQIALGVKYEEDLKIEQSGDKKQKPVRHADRKTAEKQVVRKQKRQKMQDKKDLKRLKAENNARLRREKAEEKAYLRRVKLEQKYEHRQNREQRKEREKERKRNRGLGGWITAVVALGCAVLVLGSLLTMSLFTDYMEFNKVNTNSASSQRSFYDFVGYVDNLETNMSKMIVSTDREGQQKILAEITVQSSLAEESLASLPIMDESKYRTSKFINQVGDYAKYLNNKLINGEEITEQDKQNVLELYKVNKNLKQTLSELSAKIDENYDFSALSKNDANDMIVSQFNDIEKNSMEYPEMIYDGAFSDGIMGRQPKGIKGEKINELKAQEIFKSLFSSYGIEDVKVEGKTQNGEIVCFNVISKTKENGDVFAQISEVGGKLVMFNAFKDCSKDNTSVQQCVILAEEFLSKTGFKNMTCVWSYSSGATEYLNFAYEQDGIIVYPDLVKVKVCKERGVVSGIDADNYFMNHTDRKIDEPKYTIEQAYDKVSKEIKVLSSSVAVIPTGGGNERLAYEFIGEKDGDTFYIYLDANTLKQCDIFKVVETEQGRLLI